MNVSQVSVFSSASGTLAHGPLALIVQMQGGRKGLLVNSRDLCADPSRVKANLAAHNNRRALLRPLLQARCRSNGRSAASQ